MRGVGIISSETPQELSRERALVCSADKRGVNQNGTTRYPAANGGWALEISLDLDMVSAICGTVLCTAVVGWDGPTGLGTPSGIGAF